MAVADARTQCSEWEDLFISKFERFHCTPSITYEHTLHICAVVFFQALKRLLHPPG